MGDLLMTLPALHAFRSAHPKVHTTLLLRQGLLPLLKGHPDIDRLLPWEMPGKMGWSTTLTRAFDLRKEGFDLAVIFNPTKLFHGATFLARIPVRVGYRRKLGFLLTHSLPDTKADRSLHEAFYNQELLQLLNVPTTELRLHLPVEEAEQQGAFQLLQSHGIQPNARRIVALHSFTSNPGKAWAPQAFEQLAARLAAEREIQIVWIGEGEGRVRGIGLDLIGQIPLDLLPAILKTCHALVSNDSGPAHVASAVGTPTVVVAPRAQEKVLRRWRPLGPQVRILLSPDPATVAYTVFRSLKGKVSKNDA